MKADTILDTIGRTPHVRIHRLFGRDHEVWIKQERANPAGSIKDRIAVSMVDAAERSGDLRRAGRSSSRRPATPASVSRWSLQSRATR